MTRDDDDDDVAAMYDIAALVEKMTGVRVPLGLTEDSVMRVEGAVRGDVSDEDAMEWARHDFAMAKRSIRKVLEYKNDAHMHRFYSSCRDEACVLLRSALLWREWASHTFTDWPWCEELVSSLPEEYR